MFQTQFHCDLQYRSAVMTILGMIAFKPPHLIDFADDAARICTPFIFGAG